MPCVSIEILAVLLYTERTGILFSQIPKTNRRRASMQTIKIHNTKINIRNPYLYAFLASLLIASVCVFWFFKLSVLSSFSPIAYTQEKDIDRYYNDKTRYVNCSADKLYYTGYDYLSRSRVCGHYYYSLTDNQCTIYLIAKPYITDSQNPPLVLENIRFNAALRKNDANLEPLLNYMAADLGWNYAGLERHCAKIIVSQYHYDINLYIILSILCFLSIAASILLGIAAWRRNSGTTIRASKKIGGE